jgi:hypothetical protein
MAAEGLTWHEVARRLSPALNYWLGTTDAVGAPHATPVWGAIVKDELFIYSERSTLKAKNLRIDPRAVVHLESGDDVVVVYGHFDDVGHPMDFRQVVDALAEKYNTPERRRFLPSADPDFDVLYLFRPQRALLWLLSDYEGSQRRWRAAG